LLILLIIAALSIPTLAEQVIETSVATRTIHQDYPNTVYGGRAMIWRSEARGDTLARKAYYKFEVSNIADAEVVATASLSFFIYDPPTLGSIQPVPDRTYCPQADANKAFTKQQAWPANLTLSLDPADGKTRIYSSFVYRGGLSSHVEKPQGPLNSQRNEAKLAISADDPCFGRSWHQVGYNVLHLDQSVSWQAMEDSPTKNGQLPVFWKSIGAW